MAVNELFKGITWTRRVTVTEENGSRTNLTGKTLLFELRRRTGEPVLISLTSGAGITHLTQSGDTLGQAEVTISALASPALEAAPHVYSVQCDAQVVVPPTLLEVRAL